ncbi:hypothetical protein B0H16DRAFT_1736935 [Mycena metata]|uniref:Uncharacterized protein n=1 Tax=Mycena metata TaxID=1033252 RepID=A0AAD7HM99_9AGAR|nr:hypothetical protein B0H16DRAFT_1736935 [Mycena metata]
MTNTKTHCQPRYFPQPGHEDTIVHDGRKDGRYFVVGAGHCGSGVFTDAHVADMQTNGFSGYAKRSAKRWTGLNGVEEIWATFCEDYHKYGCHRAQRLPDGWAAPTPVVRGCNAPPALVGAAAPAAAPAPAPSAPQTPRAGNGSGTSWASPLVVRSSVSPSPLRPAPPLYSIGQPASSASGGARTALDPNGGAASARSSMLSAMGSASTSSLSLSQASTSARTPQKTPTKTRIKSSPNGGYDTDYFYDSDSEHETRYWAVRGLATMYKSPDEALDALRQNMDRLQHMEIRSSTDVSKLRQFTES